jgi:uncharacterized coiled-coil protein SlyX
MKITNTQAGPRGINTVAGPVLIDPQQTINAEVYAREQAHIEAAGWFKVDGDYTADPDKPAAPPMNDDASRGRIAELEGQIAERDKTIADLRKQLPETDVDKMTVAELRAHLAFHDVAYDGTKDKKDDLVAKAKAARK